MKSFEYIADIWLKSELFGKQYSYRKGLEKDVEHLIKYFGSRNCEEIKGMDVDKFIQYETETVNIIPLLKLEKFQSNGKKLIFTQKCGKMHTVGSWQSTWESYQNTLNYEYYCQQMRNVGRVPKPYNSPTGIPQLLQHFTPHQLRHTYCTMLYHAGVDALRASKLMGHSNVQITLDIYTHLEQKYRTIDISPFNSYVRNDVANLVIPMSNMA